MPSVRRLLILLVASLLSGCGSASSGGSASSPSSTATPDVLSTCPTAVTGWQALKGAPVEAAVRGEGPLVVFANTSGNDPCDWLDLAGRLAKDGFRVAVFAYRDATAAQESQAVGDTLAVAKAAHADSFALVGASLGGRVVIEAAARHPDGLAAIVSLSGETRIDDYADITATAREVTTPTLYVGARADPLTKGTVQQDALHAAMRGQPDDLLQVAGTAHGVELLSGPTASQVTRRVTAFLHAQLS